MSKTLPVAVIEMLAVSELDDDGVSELVVLIVFATLAVVVGDTVTVSVDDRDGDDEALGVMLALENIDSVVEGVGVSLGVLLDVIDPVGVGVSLSVRELVAVGVPVAVAVAQSELLSVGVGVPLAV